MCGHHACFLGSKYTETAFAAEPRPQTQIWCIYTYTPGNLSDGCKCRFIYVKRNLKNKADWLFLDVLYVTV